jgi:hypothetical protein
MGKHLKKKSNIFLYYNKSFSEFWSHCGPALPCCLFLLHHHFYHRRGQTNPSLFLLLFPAPTDKVKRFLMSVVKHKTSPVFFYYYWEPLTSIVVISFFSVSFRRPWAACKLQPHFIRSYTVEKCIFFDYKSSPSLITVRHNKHAMLTRLKYVYLVITRE